MQSDTIKYVGNDKNWEQQNAADIYSSIDIYSFYEHFEHSNV